MSIRTRVFLTYISLIIIFLMYIILLFYLIYIGNIINSDITKIHEAKNTWNEIINSMNDIIINWNDGKTYEIFKEKSENYEYELIKLFFDIQKHYYYPDSIKKHINALLNTWNISKENIYKIRTNIESPQFKRIVQNLKNEPGLQKLNQLWMELFFNVQGKTHNDAYIIKNVIDIIEFFPIYSETVNRQFNIILEDTKMIYRKADRIQKIITFTFFILFLAICLSFSYLFSNSITKPIINSIQKLTKFLGKNIDRIKYKHNDELNQLSSAVTMLINHYTNLSDAAKALAKGDINNKIKIFSKQDIVGNALKEVSDYFTELEHTSRWIRKGNFGAKIKIKSKKDILAENFNIMSHVIDEKITTMTNILETVEEGIIVINEDILVLEANKKLLNLIGIDSIQAINERLKIADFFYDGVNFIKKCFMEKVIENYYTNMISTKNKSILVKITARPLPKEKREKKKVMLFITNESWKVRLKKEKEKLKAQAAIAGFKALQAQINPHFLFNTLNTIAQLVESDSEHAVLIIEKLADFFRYSLASTKKNIVKISEELNHIKRFLEIEKLRYDKQLDIIYDIDKNTLKGHIPPMLLQPLIENAVRYGKDENGKISILINTKIFNNNIIISISDKGHIKLDLSKFLNYQGIGIRNVNNRLKTLYNRNLSFEKNKPQGLTVSMKIPSGG